jgi:hypothetical protein
MATVTLQETLHAGGMEEDEDTGMYCTDLFMGVEGRMLRDNSEGFASEGSGPLLGRLGQLYQREGWPPKPPASPSEEGGPLGGGNLAMLGGLAGPPGYLLLPSSGSLKGMYPAPSWPRILPSLYRYGI